MEQACKPHNFVCDFLQGKVKSVKRLPQDRRVVRDVDVDCYIAKKGDGVGASKLAAERKMWTCCI